ncbi:MAG: hypothetical protein H6712_16410 [Myxococcales bacterium]|nr:hypothetical protein [Myxococcales bacterium]MCB9715453.1 hypothetical protein [Myxococcales bacterium]
MKRTLSPLLALLLLAPACGKENQGTNTPGETTGSTAGTDTGDPQAEPPPPQDPDPAELADGIDKVLTGNYEEAIGVLDPIYTGMREPSQYRASGLAGGWLAVAHAQVVFENAEAPANYALEMAGKLQDPEVDAVAKLGRGAFLLAQEDYEAAKQSFDAAASAAPDSAPGIYARMLHGETLIGTAFGSAENTELENPADLDAAKKSYEAAMTSASKVESGGDILLGRAKEGLAAIAKYQRDQDALCKNAFEAVEHYKSAGASNFLLDGPARLATDAKCKAPK